MNSLFFKPILVQRFFFVIAFSLLFIKTGNACQCPFTVLSLNECARYEVIFRGVVESNTDCIDKKGIAVFKILELYKGNSFEAFKVAYDCNVPCAMKFNVGEEWIIYTRYKQVDKGALDWCSRSRKYFKNEKEDFYTVTYGNTYDDELSFLRTKLGFHALLKNNPYEKTQRNIIPSRAQLIITLLISLVSIVLFYYFFNKYFK